MSALAEETARELIKVIRELTFVVKGLTGVLIDDRESDEASEREAQSDVEQPRTYMDGSTIQT